MREGISKRGILILTGVSVALLIILAGLQYYWIEQLGRAERNKLDDTLEREANNLRDEFNSDIESIIERTVRGQEHSPQALARRFQQARTGSGHPKLFQEAYVPTESGGLLRLSDAVEIEWPEYLNGFREHSRPGWLEDPPTIVLGRDRPPGPFPPPPEGRPDARLMFVFDAKYIREELLPQLIERHFGKDCEVEVVSSDDASIRIYGKPVSYPPISVGLLEFHPEGPEGRPGERPPPPQGHPLFLTPRWQLYARPMGGFLDAEVHHARRRNLAVSFGVLLLMAGSLGAFIVWLRRAEELARMQLEFVAGVSHELRTPLTVIRSAGENLADGVVADSGQIRKYGGLIRDEGRRLSGMVEQLLRFAGLQSGRAPLQLKPVSAQALIDRALQDLDQTPPQLEQSVTETRTIQADAGAISHCLQNLVSNALKYGDGQWVRIEAAPADKMVELAVIDRGAGIDPADAKKLFDPFYRSRRAVDSQIHGLGIGLSLVKRIAEAHGGRVQVANMPSGSGGGARFSIFLPTV